MIQPALKLANPAKAGDPEGHKVQAATDETTNGARPFAATLERENQKAAPKGKELPDGNVLPDGGRELPEPGNQMPPMPSEGAGDPKTPGAGQSNATVHGDTTAPSVQAEAIALLVSNALPSAPATTPEATLPVKTGAQCEPATQTLLQNQAARNSAKPDGKQSHLPYQDAANVAPLLSDRQPTKPQAAQSAVLSESSYAITLDVARIGTEPGAQQGATSPAPSFAAVPAAVRPHEFASLVDRLVTARELAGTHQASITVDHADFGQVHLRFEQRDAGLAVAMSSADPDFNRAVSAAAATLPSTLDRDNSQSGSGNNPGFARGDNAPAGQGGGSRSEGDSNNPFQNGERHAADANGPVGSENNKDRSRKGIFA